MRFVLAALATLFLSGCATEIFEHGHWWVKTEHPCDSVKWVHVKEEGEIKFFFPPDMKDYGVKAYVLFSKAEQGPRNCAVISLISEDEAKATIIPGTTVTTWYHEIKQHAERGLTHPKTYEWAYENWLMRQPKR